MSACRLSESLPSCLENTTVVASWFQGTCLTTSAWTSPLSTESSCHFQTVTLHLTTYAMIAIQQSVQFNDFRTGSSSTLVRIRWCGCGPRLSTASPNCLRRARNLRTEPLSSREKRRTRVQRDHTHSTLHVRNTIFDHMLAARARLVNPYFERTSACCSRCASQNKGKLIWIRMDP